MAVDPGHSPPFPALHELLPHRPPMLLLRTIHRHAPGETVCGARFGADDARRLGGTAEGLPASLALELIAQTMAVHDGLRRWRQEESVRAAGGTSGDGGGRPPTHGLLLGSRRFTCAVRLLPLHVDLWIIVRSGDGNGDGDPAPGRGLAAAAGLIRFTGTVEAAAGGGDVRATSGASASRALLAGGDVTVLESSPTPPSAWA